jgi:hypothetical protein
MGKLGDILGDEFEEEYNSNVERGTGSANKVEKAILMEICHKAINEGGFEGSKPRFRFDAGAVDHDVLLMESPANDLDRFTYELGEDAMSLGMFHMNDLFSCAFRKNMLDLLDKIDTDEYYLVVGDYEEKIQASSDGEEEVYYNVNPVRGIIPIHVAKEYANTYEEKMAESSIEEQSSAQSSESSAESSQSSDPDPHSDGGSVPPEAQEVDYDKIVQVFQAISNNAPAIIQQVADGDDEAIDKLVTVTNSNLQQEAEEDRILDVFEEEIQEIPGRGEEEEEDTGIDLGSIGDSLGSDSDSDASQSEPEPEPDSEPTTEPEVEDDDSDDDDEVDGWF